LLGNGSIFILLVLSRLIVLLVVLDLLVFLILLELLEDSLFVLPQVFREVLWLEMV
jgi:hypothetical protein